MINDRVLNKFLESSDFENINGVFDMFRIWFDLYLFDFNLI